MYLPPPVLIIPRAWPNLCAGSDKGIGLEFVKQLSSTGYKVIATAKNPGKADMSGPRQERQWSQALSTN